MRKNFGAGIRELTAFIQRKKAGRHLAQVELPGFIPMIGFGQFEWSGANLKLGKGKDIVDGTVWRPGKDARVEFNLGLVISDLLNAANAMRPIGSTQAAHPCTRFDVGGFIVKAGRTHHSSELYTAAETSRRASSGP